MRSYREIRVWLTDAISSIRWIIATQPGTQKPVFGERASRSFFKLSLVAPPSHPTLLVWRRFRKNPVHGPEGAALSAGRIPKPATAYDIGLRQAIRECHWKSLLTSYPPGGIEMCESEEAKGDGVVVEWERKMIATVAAVG
ncbi:MAG: hypothetical protein WBQ34_01440, partial [Candidatus Acidiferrales bacterium]